MPNAPPLVQGIPQANNPIFMCRLHEEVIMLSQGLQQSRKNANQESLCGQAINEHATSTSACPSLNDQVLIHTPCTPHHMKHPQGMV